MEVLCSAHFISSITLYLEWPCDRDGLYCNLRGSHPACAHTRRSGTKNCQKVSFNSEEGEFIYFISSEKRKRLVWIVTDSKCSLASVYEMKRMFSFCPSVSVPLSPKSLPKISS